MKYLNVFAASLALACCPLLAVAALADQDLEVTMEVIDDISELDGLIAEMPGPQGDTFREDGEGTQTADGPDERPAGRSDDGFEHDDMDEDRIERDLRSEGDFTEGEDVDIDVDDFEDGSDEMEDPAEHAETGDI
jgi:hypothetical protein